MTSLYDWATVILFAALSALFLQRSWGPKLERDEMVRYIPAAIGCAVSNALGNSGQHFWATLVLIATVIALYLRWRAPHSQ